MKLRIQQTGLIADQTKLTIVNLEDTSEETTQNSTWKVKTTGKHRDMDNIHENTARWPENISSI